MPSLMCHRDRGKIREAKREKKGNVGRWVVTCLRHVTVNREMGVATGKGTESGSKRK